MRKQFDDSNKADESKIGNTLFYIVSTGRGQDCSSEIIFQDTASAAITN